MSLSIRDLQVVPRVVQILFIELVEALLHRLLVGLPGGKPSVAFSTLTWLGAKPRYEALRPLTERSELVCSVANIRLPN